MECRQQLAGLLDNDSFGSLCIGPAGEEWIPSATVISDDRAAGRSGLGAVLGWKNLKAITVTGSKPIPIYNKEKTIVENKKWFLYPVKNIKKVRFFPLCRLHITPN